MNIYLSNEIFILKASIMFEPKKKKKKINEFFVDKK